MLKINKDMSVELAEDTTPEDIVNILIAFNNNQFTANLASVLQIKDKSFIKRLEQTILEALVTRFDEDYRAVFLSVNRPFFAQLGIGRPTPPPAISPLNAFKK